jgi:broad specificity phosphatase PhoE
MEEKFPFPENYVMFHHRVGKYKEKLRFPPTGEATIIVTHGFVVREMCWRMNQVPNIMAEVPYCGYAAFLHDGKQDVLLKARL